MSFRVAVGSLSAALVVASNWAAGPAHADSITDDAVGTYTLMWKLGTPDSKWVLTPCDGDTPRCVAINQYGLTDPQFKKPSFVGNAYWTVGSWVMQSRVKRLIACKDGEKFDFDATWSWDAGGTQGYRSYIDPGLCGPDNKGKDVTAKFLLYKEGPGAPAPPAAAPVPAPAAAAPAAPPAAAPAPAAPAELPPAGAAESSAPPPAA